MPGWSVAQSVPQPEPQSSFQTPPKGGKSEVDDRRDGDSEESSLLMRVVATLQRDPCLTLVSSILLLLFNLNRAPWNGHQSLQHTIKRVLI